MAGLEAERAYRSGRAATIAFGLLAVLSGGILAWLITRSIALPLAQAIEMMRELEKGRLSHRLTLQRTDEIGDLAQAMDRFAENLEVNLVDGQETPRR